MLPSSQEGGVFNVAEGEVSHVVRQSALASNKLHQFSTSSLVRVKVDEADVSARITRAESTAPQALATLWDSWRERLPAGTDALWAFVSQADQTALLELVAVLIAPALELRTGGDVADAICEAAGLDMSRYWSATCASFFEHVRKDVAIDAVMEVSPALDRSKLDKSSKKEVLARAKRVFKGSNWLPEMLRAHTASAPAAVAAIASIKARATH